MKNTFKCALNERGIILQFGEEKYLMSYEETRLPWNKAREWAKEKSGDLFPWQHSMVFAEHVDEINVLLEEAGKEKLGGWLWTDREYSTRTNCAWAVLMLDGIVHWIGKSSNRYVRAVSAF